MGRLSPEVVIEYKGHSYEASLSQNEDSVPIYRGESFVGMGVWDKSKRRLSSVPADVPVEIVRTMSHRLRLAKFERAMRNRAYQRARHATPEGRIVSFKADPLLPSPPFEYRMRVATQDEKKHIFTVFVAADGSALFFQDKKQIGRAIYDYEYRQIAEYRGQIILFSVWARLVRQLTEYRFY
jgi:hypothetical protein